MAVSDSSSRIHIAVSPQRGHESTHTPQLAVAWEAPSDVFWSSFRALLYGPAPPQGWPQGPFFRDSWVRTNLPTKALLASVLWHFILFNVNVPFWAFFGTRTKPKQEYPRIEVTWYTPPRDLPPLVAPSLPKKSRQPSPPGEEKKPLPPKGADAFHPRQIILSAPARPTHPRQTLIQPDSPPEAPKILPALPNIVQWNQPALPPRPKLTLHLPRLKRKEARRPPPESAAPAVVAEQRLAGEINIAPSAISIPRPRLAIAASAVARAGARTAINTVEPAPEVASATLNGSELGAKNIIALSANPAPPAPEVQVPAGNLSARILISPEGTQPGVPGGSSNGTAGSTGGAGGTTGSPGGMGSGAATQPGAGTGPAGISITGGDPSKAASSSGLGGSGAADSRPDRPIPANPRPERLTARNMPLTPDSASAARANPSPAFEPIKPGAPPEVILGPKRIYTLNVNAPNMASATGSWVMQFAELNEDINKSNGPPLSLRADPQMDLVGPVPMRKVDPKYPPALMSARVQGDVILYAIIRKDGSVDSIQLVKGIEPRLDQNAMEALARWKFRPAERRGEPVELEAVVTIPFRAAARF
jgi:protein TonB